MISGKFNLAIGLNAGYQITSGSYNICIGENAGDWITDESFLLVIGNYIHKIESITEFWYLRKYFIDQYLEI